MKMNVALKLASQLELLIKLSKAVGMVSADWRTF